MTDASSVSATGRLPLVEVLWRDSMSIPLGWAARAEYHAVTGDEMRCRTAGYLLRDDPLAIVVVQSIDDDNGDADGGMAIPRSAIIRVRRL